MDSFVQPQQGNDILLHVYDFNTSNNDIFAF